MQKVPNKMDKLRVQYLEEGESDAGSEKEVSFLQTVKLKKISSMKPGMKPSALHFAQQMNIEDDKKIVASVSDDSIAKFEDKKISAKASGNIPSFNS